MPTTTTDQWTNSGPCPMPVHASVSHKRTQIESTRTCVNAKPSPRSGRRVAHSIFARSQQIPSNNGARHVTHIAFHLADARAHIY